MFGFRDFVMDKKISQINEADTFNKVQEFEENIDIVKNAFSDYIKENRFSAYKASFKLNELNTKFNKKEFIIVGNFNISTQKEIDINEMLKDITENYLFDKTFIVDGENKKIRLKTVTPFFGVGDSKNDYIEYKISIAGVWE